MAIQLDGIPSIQPGETPEAYLPRLVAALRGNFDTLERSFGGTQYIYDNLGRPLVTPEGLYAYDALGNVPVSPSIVQIGTEQLVDAAVVLAKIADEAVDTAKIKDAAIISAKILDAAIITAKIGDLAVVTAKIDDLAVNEAKIANLAVGTAKIQNLAVSTGKIADLAVTTAKIAALAVGTAQIDNLAVTGAKIADATIQAAKIVDATITGAKIASATISAVNIVDATITGAKIANATINTANIANLAITAALIADATITSAKIGALAVLTGNIADLAVTAAKIANLAVGTAQIADAAISTAKIAALAVGTGQIANLAVTTAKIANLAVGTAQIGDLAVTDAKIANATITSAKISNLAADKITSGVIGSQQIYLGGTLFVLDGTNRNLLVADENAILRVVLGRLGPGAANYGINIRDQFGNDILTANGLGVNVVGQNQIQRSAYMTQSDQSRNTPFGLASTTYQSIVNSGNIAIAPSTDFPYLHISATAALRISSGSVLSGLNCRVRIATPSGDVIPFAGWLALQQLSIGGDYRNITSLNFGLGLTGLPTGNYVVHFEAMRPYGDATVEVDHVLLSTAVFKKAL